MPTYKLSGTQKLTEILVKTKLCKSASEVKRLIKQNAISINNEKISDILYEVSKESTIKVGKRRFLKVVK